jgi:hypothetical protein
MQQKKMAQITLRIDHSLKGAAEKAAAYDHCSLTFLIERLLTKHLQRRGLFGVPRRPSKLTARTALKLAARELGSIEDKSLAAEERKKRKRQLTWGPREFRDMRSDQPKATRRRPGGQTHR